MKKLYLTMAGLLCLSAANAQTILSEDFETGNKGDTPLPVAVGEGWTTINSYKGDKTSYNWHNYYSNPNGEYTSSTISGEGCAACEGPYIYNEDGAGPREEILLSPELDLNGNYQLEFKFKVSPMNYKETSRYDIQVRVVTDGDLTGAETIFSIQNEKMLRESGITVYPIDNWNVYTAKIGLADFKGEKVKLAFVYKMYAETANVAWIDDVIVKAYTPATGPVPSLSINRLDFSGMYIGEKSYSDVITLTNTGKDGLKINSIEAPAGFGTTLNIDDINLLAYGHTDFRVSYEASMTSAASGNLILHTNGGDVSIAVTASKQFVPEDATLELFEQYFPPAGWTSTGWTWSNYALEGDHSVYCSGDYGSSYLRSPRLNLENGGSVSFTFYNQFEEDGYPEYDVELQVSEDGGNSWTTKWISNYMTQLNQIITETVDLGTLSDNSYIRFYYPAVEADDEGAYPHSMFILDRVVLPNIYGADGVPTAVTKPSPANNATNIYPRNVELSWAPAQFVKGYKLYVGSNAAANDLIDGLDLGNVLSYTIPLCDYETLYRWKVVGYNDNGNCDSATTWKFTTQPDASVTDYPYVQDFTDLGSEKFPTGWTCEASENYGRVWSLNELAPYVGPEGTYGAFYTMWLQTGNQNSITTQDFKLPTDDSMQISFIWGDEHPRSLVVDETGLVKKNNVVPNNGNSEIIFSIYADGEWTDLSNISENYFDGDHKYWINEKIDLTPYKGKTVQFRWTHKAYSGRDNGASLTHIVLERILGDKAKFNRQNWDAGKVNFEKATASGNIFTILNEGVNTLTVKSADFATPNFSCDIEPGTVIEPNEGHQFSIRFDALNSAAPIEDDLTVEFESGYKLSFPVSGEALPEFVHYYSFEPNELDHQWTNDFNMIDVDRGNGYTFSSYWVHYSMDGQKCAFSVESDSMEDGLYGMMNPISGTHALVASSPQSANADNWIIFKKMHVKQNASFDFWCRNWECLTSVLPDPKHNVTVLVSTAGNTNTADFTPVMRKTEIPFLNDKEWIHYEVDLSGYAGQDIHVALRHTTDSPSNLAFFDDFTFKNLDEKTVGIDAIAAAGEDAVVEVFSASGVLVTRGTGIATLRNLDKGFYVVRISENGASRVVRIVK